MKKVLLCTLVTLFAAGANAQVTAWDGSAPEKKVTIGPRVGLNISSVTGDVEDIKSKVGFNVGAAVDFNIVKSFSITTGLFYSTKGAKSEWKDDELTEKNTVNVGYLELPVYASYRLNFNESSQLQVNFGPYFAFGVNGKSTYEYKYWDDTEKEKEDVFGDDGYLNRFDCGLGVGVSYVIKNVYVGLSYQFGLTNIAKDSDGKIKNSNFGISVGYNF